MSDAPERIKAWVWDLDYPSKKNGSAEWNATMFPADQDCHEYIRADLMAELVEALRWYGEVGRLARLITREGDAGRAAISADGGQRAAAALAKIKEASNG